jgi:hypothetical protein
MQALPQGEFSCPVFFENLPELSVHGYDCRLFTRELPVPLAPGGSADVRMAFLSWKEIASKVHIGTRFSLWEGKTIGHGEIVRL